MLNSSNRCMLAKLDRTLQNNIQMLELLNLSSEDFPRRFLLFLHVSQNLNPFYTECAMQGACSKDSKLAFQQKY